ncbi:hypothetical protein F5148DRAFT_1258223 [Russula earlei]|uniref:Uncharacterized protein n=1 Tax=Russula earlei TaxID=71964 RepID=A0ACC0TSK0_9AGAM|nr:hypothetical protein F5148DRAFT_1258223 [Russula earlei]
MCGALLNFIVFFAFSVACAIFTRRSDVVSYRCVRACSLSNTHFRLKDARPANSHRRHVTVSRAREVTRSVVCVFLASS